jgi:FdrA protein
MTIKSVIYRGEYHDSVSLMNTAKAVTGAPGVKDCAVVMVTQENRGILKNSGLLTPEVEAAQEGDLAVVVSAQDDASAEAAHKNARELLSGRNKKSSGGAAAAKASTLEGAAESLGGANMAVISVAGRYAAAVADSALERGMHVMLFSDNVKLADEVALKKKAAAKGLLVMGPDCGTAIINGAPLCFANAVSRGMIGVVGAAGTGMQEVTTLISNEGEGISQAIGTGGRDIKRDVGGIMFMEGLKALAADPATRVILMVSKPPHPEVMEKIVEAARGIAKPMVALFLGGDTAILEEEGIYPAKTLEEAALKAVALARFESAPQPSSDSNALARETNRYLMALKDVETRLNHSENDIKRIAFDEARKLNPSQNCLRGLYTGGTFCYEAQLILEPLLGGVWSNAPVSPAYKLKDALRSEGNTIIDLGEDEFTVGRPHPMIDFTLRNRRILDEARDPAVAVILLDLVIGWGSNMKPMEDLLPTLAQARDMAERGGRHIVFVASVTGTEQDPQGRSAAVKGLRDAGVIVLPTNAQAAILAGHIIRISGGRQ